MANSAIDILFPTHPPPFRPYLGEILFTPKFTLEEKKVSVNRISNSKAPGIDRISNEVVKVAALKCPELFLMTFDHCLESGVFPKIWKRTKLVLLNKAGKPPELASSHRPICLISAVGKLFKRMIYNRIIRHLSDNERLSSSQYGFRSGKSTVYVIATIQRLVNQAHTNRVTFAS